MPRHRVPCTVIAHWHKNAILGLHNRSSWVDGRGTTLLPGGCARRSEVEECTKIKLHLAGERLRNSEMRLITDSNFTNAHVKLHASELLRAEQPEVEAKLPRLDLRSGFQCHERC